MQRRKNKAMREIEARRGRDIEAWLRGLYYQQEMTLAEIAQVVGKDEATISRWFKRLGIPTRRWALPSDGNGRVAAESAERERQEVVS